MSARVGLGWKWNPHRTPGAFPAVVHGENTRFLGALAPVNVPAPGCACTVSELVETEIVENALVESGFVVPAADTASTSPPVTSNRTVSVVVVPATVTGGDASEFPSVRSRTL